MEQESRAGMSPLPEDLALKPFTRSMEVQQDGAIVAHHGPYQLKSAFQPIYSYAHKRPVGYEALVRPQDAQGKAVSPGLFLGSARSLDETVFLDRLLRALHVANFFRHPPEDAWIFLNVNPVVVIHGPARGSFFRAMLEAFQVPAHRVVVEVMETGTREEDHLERTAAYYREVGCLVAIDDFGAGHSNFNRIWNIKPDIIKLDRAMIQKAAADPVARRSLTHIVALLHEIGALVVAEGIESRQEALVAVNADMDLLQGFYFARPSTGLGGDLSCHEQFATLHEHFKRQMHEEDVDFGLLIRPHRGAFVQSANLLAEGHDPTVATRIMLSMPNVQRCYLLDEHGTQMGEILPSVNHRVPSDPRHGPLSNARGGSWIHRPYFRRAMAKPGAMQITRPYLSFVDARMCLTLSMAIPAAVGTRVLCCDIRYPPRAD